MRKKDLWNEINVTRSFSLICSQQRSAGRPVTVLVFIRRRRASCRPPIILISIIPPSTIRIEGARLTINTGTTRWAPPWDRPIIITIIKRRVYNTCIIVSLLHVSSSFLFISLWNEYNSFLEREEARMRSIILPIVLWNCVRRIKRIYRIPSFLPSFHVLLFHNWKAQQILVSRYCASFHQE